MSREENRRHLLLWTPIEERLTERQWGTALKVDAKSSQMKTKIIPLGCHYEDHWRSW